MTTILQTSLPYDPDPRALPGVGPLDMADWLMVDDAFAAQMAERGRLLRTRRAEVLAMTPEGQAPAEELLQYVLDWLAQSDCGYVIGAKEAQRPDGQVIPLRRDDPLGTLCDLVQEDFCLLTRQGDEHVLSAAILCFPASWRLADKIGRPLSTIHDPVPEYDADITRRVQRLFDGVRVGRPLWRYNVLSYADPDLFQPARRTDADRDGAARTRAGYLRSERQCVLRLPHSGACVFSIHSFVLEKPVPGFQDRAPISRSNE